MNECDISLVQNEQSYCYKSISLAASDLGFFPWLYRDYNTQLFML